MNDKGIVEASPDSYPFYSVASLLYTHGFMAVDLFFAISGFIFFWLYAEAVNTHRVTITRFMLLRLSRLYPLVLLTLIFVAALQMYYRRATGTFFVYPFNYRYPFLQHLTMTNVWTNAGEFSFNGPAWSLSTEMFLYVLFVLLCRFVAVRVWLLMAIVCVGHFFYENYYFTAVRGIEPFFLGGLMYSAFRAIERSGRVVFWSRIIMGATVVAWIIGCGVALSPIRPEDIIAPPNLGARRLHVLFECFARLVIFPLTVLALSLLELRRGTLGRRVAVIGDISFSSYLIHFPLQLLAATVVWWLALNHAIYSSPIFMIGFFVLLIAVSISSHRYLEMPAQKFLRQRAKFRPRTASS